MTMTMWSSQNDLVLSSAVGGVINHTLKKTTYRLSEYKITEYGNGVLSWDSHFGFAAEREGRCFLVGNILFLGPWLSEEAGFFKREFFDHIKDLPVWDKTEYYSLQAEIYSCTNNRNVPLEEVWQNQKRKSPRRGVALSPQSASGNVSYRLNRYQITMGQGGRIKWKTWGRSNNVKIGSGIVMEDILFLGFSRKERILPRKEFLSHLKSLPAWDHTSYYCRCLDLRSCSTGENMRIEEDGGNPGVESPRYEKGDSSCPHFLQDPISRHLRSELGRVYEIAPKRLATFTSSSLLLLLNVLKKLKQRRRPE